MANRIATARTEPSDRAIREAQPIVSSSHLISPKTPGLSEVEFGLIIAGHAFERWMTRCMAAAGMKDMPPLNVLVLHRVNHQSRPKRLADICFALSIEDTHVVSYSLKKLTGLGLVQNARRGKEVLLSTTKAGKALCERYCKVRETCLLPSFSDVEEEGERIADKARTLRTLSGRYDQAARSATRL